MRTSRVCNARVAAVVAAVAFAALPAGCGGEVSDNRASIGAGEPTTSAARIDGVSVAVPPGWDAYTTWLGHDNELGAIWAASIPIVEPSPPDAFPYETLAGLPADGIAVQIIAQPAQVGASWPLRQSLSLDDGYFLSDGYETQPAPHVSKQVIEARLDDRPLLVEVYFGRIDLDEAMRARANRMLASIRASPSAEGEPRETRRGDTISFADPDVGISGRYPAGWHRTRALTSLVDPREVFVLANYPLRQGAEAGECAPSTARADMPASGTFIWLVEYRPSRGHVWAELPRDRFPARPRHFEVVPREGENVGCFDGPGYSTTFEAADRPFQLLVSFGSQPTVERLAEVEAILDDLHFEALPPLPPDPYVGWPMVNDNPGDSFMPPPRWPATAAMFPLRTPRPRPLFFASNEPLRGLPSKLVRFVDELPAPFPSVVANGFPADGVLLWVVEEAKGGSDARFPEIAADWPRRDAFRRAEPPVPSGSRLDWLRAGGSFRGYRFSVWIAAGPSASGDDVTLALKSAASVAVSSCRDDFAACGDG